MTSSAITPDLGRFGVWAHEDKLGPDVARGLEDLGFTTVWIGGSPGGDLRVVDDMLAATDSMTVATGIVNIWKDDARTIAADHRRITTAYPGRFLLGVGVGHPEATSDYRHPYEALVGYLDILDAEGVPEHERVLAALGPKVLRLARDRCAGAHPYLTTPRHTREARDILGPGKILGPEQKVVLDTDSEVARSVGRETVKYYLGLRNYVANLKRTGFSDDDVAGEGSDRLVDELALHGTPDDIAAGLRVHLAAGADHVAVQLLTNGDLVDGLRPLAATLTG